jgi:hypothetical protein
MKKQIKKLSLNKKTISNLQSSEMNKMVGGQWTQYKCHWPNKTKNCSVNANTCAGHNTCQDTCI